MTKCFTHHPLFISSSLCINSYVPFKYYRMNHMLNSVLGVIRFISVLGFYTLSALFQLPCPVWWLLSFGWWRGATEVHHQSGHLPTPAPAHGQYLVRFMYSYVYSLLSMFLSINSVVSFFCTVELWFPYFEHGYISYNGYSKVILNPQRCLLDVYFNLIMISHCISSW